MLINRNIVALFALPFMASATASELSIGAGAAYNESPGNDSNLLIVFYVQIMPDDFVMQLHR
ncbi:MipA/OmpV family protein, partial [Escherichia coli]